MAKRILSIIAATALLLVNFGTTAKAAVTSCNAYVDHDSVKPSSTYEFRINVVDSTVPDTIQWVKITRPSANFTINGTSSDSWTNSVSASDITFTGNTIDSTYAFTFVISVTTGSSEAASAGWTVQASNTDGSAAITCGGSPSTSISASAPNPDTTAPVISDITVSDVTDSAVKIAWTTDENSNTSVDYGLTDAYSFNSSDSSQNTSHTMGIGSLSANTTYHYNIKSTDSSGNTGESGDRTFVTALTGQSQGTTSQSNTSSVSTKTPSSTKSSGQNSFSGFSQNLGKAIKNISPQTNILGEKTGPLISAPPASSPSKIKFIVSVILLLIGPAVILWYSVKKFKK